jgi:hypothetical protein
MSPPEKRRGPAQGPDATVISPSPLSDSPEDSPAERALTDWTRRYDLVELAADLDVDG